MLNYFSQIRRDDRMRHYFHSKFIPTITLVFALALSSYVTAHQPRRRGSARKLQTAEPTARFDSGDSALKIPLEIDNNLILMRVQVNHSKPLKFIFDTGASFSIINSQRA